MNLDELKNAIEKETGVPGSLLTGVTAEENIDQARALLAFKRECEARQPQTASEQFVTWFNSIQGVGGTDEPGGALDEIQAAVNMSKGGYPKVPDGGDPPGCFLDSRPVRESFAEWMWQQSAFDPFKSAGGWKRMI